METTNQNEEQPQAVQLLKVSWRVDRFAKNKDSEKAIGVSAIKDGQIVKKVNATLDKTPEDIKDFFRRNGVDVSNLTL